MSAETDIEKLGEEMQAMARRLARQLFPDHTPEQQMAALETQLRIRYKAKHLLQDRRQAPLDVIWAESTISAIGGDLIRSGYLRYAMRALADRETPASIAAAEGIGPFPEPSIQSKGGRARHGPSRQVREYVIAEYRAAHHYKSVRSAASQLVPIALEYARSINFRMSEPNAMETVYRWLRSAENQSS